MSNINKKFNFWFAIILINFIFSSSLLATGPRITPILFSSEKNEIFARSEEHTSELQSHIDLVCRLLLAKKK